MPQAEILLRRRNPRVADDQPPPASRWSKETRRSGFFEMKSLSNRRCKENARFSDHRAGTEGDGTHERSIEDYRFIEVHAARRGSSTLRSITRMALA